jgi:hypothetical protein
LAHLPQAKGEREKLKKTLTYCLNNQVHECTFDEPPPAEVYKLMDLLSMDVKDTERLSFKSFSVGLPH